MQLGKQTVELVQENGDAATFLHYIGRRKTFQDLLLVSSGIQMESRQKDKNTLVLNTSQSFLEFIFTLVRHKKNNLKFMELQRNKPSKLYESFRE
jgi:hypothetical protein